MKKVMQFLAIPLLILSIAIAFDGIKKDDVQLLIYSSTCLIAGICLYYFNEDKDEN